MGDSARVSSYEGLTIPLETTLSNISSQTDFELPIRVTGTVTSPAYKGASAASAGASLTPPRHSSVWTKESKGVGGVNSDSVTGSSGFTGQGVRKCKITSLSVIRAAGSATFTFEIYRKSARTAQDLVISSSSGGGARIDVALTPTDYQDEGTATKGADGQLYCRVGPGGSASTYTVRVEVEPQ